MNDLAVVVFDDETQANGGFRALRELAREKKLTRYADAIVTRPGDGTELVCMRLRTGHAGTLLGLLVGGLVGLLRGPLGVAFGAGTGMLVGELLDLIVRRSIREEFLKEASPRLIPGSAALITELDESSRMPLDTRMQALGGKVYRRSGVQVEASDGQVISSGRT